MSKIQMWLPPEGTLEPSDEVHDLEEAMDIAFDYGLGCKNLLIDHAWNFSLSFSFRH